MSISIAELNQRSLDIFRELVDAYVETGDPVGSRTLSRRLEVQLSPATIRNVMADLEEAGLLYSPHTSAGRMPTDKGLRFFVNGLLERGNISKGDQDIVEQRCQSAGHNLPALLEEATSLLSGLSQCAGLVVAPKTDSKLKHVEFVGLGPDKALVVLITEDGLVENRVIKLPNSLPPSALVEATNYLSSRLAGKSLKQAKEAIFNELSQHKADLDELASKVVEDGLAIWAGGEEGGSLIVKGQANLLGGLSETQDLEQIRTLFETLEAKESMVKLLDESIGADGVQIFIGAENGLFNLSGCSAIVSPYHNSQDKVVGAIGVIGPTHMNYGKIIPLVDYTAKLIGKMIA